MEKPSVPCQSLSRVGTVHVLATSPALLMSLDAESGALTATHLDGHVDSTYYSGPEQRFRLAVLPNARLLIYDAQVLPPIRLGSRCACAYSSAGHLEKRTVFGSRVRLVVPSTGPITN